MPEPSLWQRQTLKELSEELQIDCEEIVQAMESSVEVESIYKPIQKLIDEGVYPSKLF